MRQYLLVLSICFSLFGKQSDAQEKEIYAKSTGLPFGVASQRINNTPKKTIAFSPPMGWNSWNNFGLDITEAEFKKQVDYVAAHLKPFGYEYMVIDAGWYAPQLSADKTSPHFHGYQTKYTTTVDSFGRWLPAVNKFPSAVTGGFRSLADYVHSKGLKFGLHVQRGIPWTAVLNDTRVMNTAYRAKDIANPADACYWWDGTLGLDMTHPASQEYYNSCIQQYADWGVDFLKVDDITRPYHADEITAFRIAIEKTGRDIILSLSPGTTIFTARHHAINNSDMYRISNDFWDSWRQLKHQFSLANEWLKYQATGHYADLDMLPVGVIGSRSSDGGAQRKTRFTETEQYTMLSLWAIFRSPLILGNDLTQMDSFTYRLVTNPEMLEVNQKGVNLKSVKGLADNRFIFYSTNPDQKITYAALFNLGEKTDTIVLDMSALGLQGPVQAKDIWQKKNIGQLPPKSEFIIPPHGSLLLRLWPGK